jgi:hypothetical protein
MPIPNAASAVVPAAKLTDYLLNTSHPVGGPKARWFISLGYDPGRPDRLATDLLEIVRHGKEFRAESLPFGVKYVVLGQIVTPSGRAVDIVTVWITEPNDRAPRLVTAYPSKETLNERT